MRAHWLKNVFKNPTEFIQKYKGQKVFVEGVLSVTHLLNPLLSLMLLIISSLSISEWERITTLKTHPSLRKKNFLLSGSQRKKKTEIILDNCITGLDYQKVKIGEIEQGIKDFLSGKDKTNPNMPTYAMLAYMALVSAKLLPTQLLLSGSCN